jgi:hypothetical protein
VFNVLGYINVKTARILRDEIHRICVQVMLTHPPKIESHHAFTVAIDESVFIKRKVSNLEDSVCIKMNKYLAVYQSRICQLSIKTAMHQAYCGI